MPLSCELKKYVKLKLTMIYVLACFPEQATSRRQLLNILCDMVIGKCNWQHKFSYKRLAWNRLGNLNELKQNWDSINCQEVASGAFSIKITFYHLKIRSAGCSEDCSLMELRNMRVSVSSVLKYRLRSNYVKYQIIDLLLVSMSSHVRIPSCWHRHFTQCLLWYCPHKWRKCGEELIITYFSTMEQDIE